MSAEDRKYVRVYYNDLIRDYPDVWADDAQLATWLRLLATADPMWPTPPELPRSVRPRALAALVASSLVAIAGHRFQMKGMDAERIRRSDAGRKGAAVRWQNEGIANRSANAMPKRAETSRDEQSSSAPASGNDPWDAPETEALAWLSRHGCDVRPGNGYHQKLVTAVEAHGVPAIIGMFDRLAGAGVKNGDIKGFLFGATDALNARTRPQLRALVKDDNAERESDRTRKNLERTKRDIHATGFHQDAPDPTCPACREAGVTA